LLAQPAGRGAISGTVADASSGDPVRKAIVTVTWHGTPRAWATTRTDGSGRFSFDGLPAGKYDLRAHKQGLGVAIYGANSVRELGDTITLGEGETRANLTLRFLRSATIGGRVMDQDGDPLSSSGVNLLRPSRNLGERVLVNYQSTMTDDRGEYKFTGIDPGEYYLHVVPNSPRPMGTAPHEILVPQYFGGAVDSKDATPVRVRGSDILTGIDFHIAAQRPASVSGHISGVPPLNEAPDGAPPPQMISGRRIVRGQGPSVMVELNPLDTSQPGFQGGVGAGAQGPDYRFGFAENVPGRYRLQASVHTKGKAYYASQVVDLHEGANEVELAMVPGVAVKGSLKIEGPGANRPETFRVTLATPGLGVRIGQYTAAVKKDGSFVIDDVPPGEWVLNVDPSQPGVFEKSVRLGGKDFLFKRLEIPAGLDAPLNIVLSSNTAEISGQVDGTGGRAGILLEPMGSTHTLARFYYSASADDDGKFKLTGVGAGKYKIYALEKIATANYRNPESAELLEALGEEIDVTEGARLESHPKLIPEDRAREILKP
jgi:hypothetical protein